MIGGPDRIRTGDLGLDRAACWATTLRVQINHQGYSNGDSMVEYTLCQQGATFVHDWWRI